MEENNNFENLYKENVKPKRFFKRLGKKLLICVSSLLLSLAFGFALTSGYNILKNSESLNFNEDGSLDAIVVSSNNDGYSNEYNIKNIIKKVTPSIVTITTLNKSENIFNIVSEYEGAGSGIIFYTTSEYTYILTNNHVIDGANKVGIAIDDYDVIYASLVGKDENNDLAVISVSNSDLKKAGITDVTVATFGDSDNMNEGDSVIAIGNALGEGKTATLGIISSTSKEIYVDGKYLNVLQTTAAINPGNSGGALINSKGEVIGINTAKVADTDVNGIGYSISSNVAIPIVEKIMNKSSYPALDIYVSDASNYSQDGLGLGALVVSVLEGGSADKGGILQGDIITSVGETPIFNAEQLVEEIKNYSIGDVVKINVIRDNETITLKIKLRKTVNESDTSF